MNDFTVLDSKIVNNAVWRCVENVKSKVKCEEQGEM